MFHMELEKKKMEQSSKRDGNTAMIDRNKTFIKLQQELLDDMNKQIDELKKKYYLVKRGESSTGAKV